MLIEDIKIWDRYRIDREW